MDSAPLLHVFVQHAPYFFNFRLIFSLTSGLSSRPAARTGRLGSLKNRRRTAANGSTA